MIVGQGFLWSDQGKVIRQPSFLRKGDVRSTTDKEASSAAAATTASPVNSFSSAP